MLKKTITYEDVDGNPVTEDFYFNLNKAEIAEMELSRSEGLSGFLEQIIASENAAEIVATFKQIILKAYGMRSDDGKRFIKSEELSNEFLQKDAYSVLFMELVVDADKSAEFVRSIVPADLRGDLDSPVRQVARRQAVQDVVSTALNEPDDEEDEEDEEAKLEARLAELRANKPAE